MKEVDSNSLSEVREREISTVVESLKPREIEYVLNRRVLIIHSMDNSGPTIGKIKGTIHDTVKEVKNIIAVHFLGGISSHKISLYEREDQEDSN